MTYSSPMRRTRFLLTSIVASASLLVGLGIMALPSSATDVTVGGVVVHEAIAISTIARPAQASGYEVSCPADGECVMVGRVSDSTTPAVQQFFVAVQKAGVWGDGQIVAFPAGTFMEGVSGAVPSCWAPGECGVIMQRLSVGGGQLSFFSRVTAGAVQAAQLLTVSGITQSTPEDTELSGISCPASGTCTITGSTVDSSSNSKAVEWTVTNGIAAAGTAVPLGSLTDTNARSIAVGIDCVAVGECVETGHSTPASGEVGWIRVQSAGAWGAAQAITFAAGALGTRAPMGGAVRCWSAGECMVAGAAPSTAAGGISVPFALAVVAGVPQTAKFIGLDPSVTGSTGANTTGLSCYSSGNCLLAFSVDTPSGTVPEYATATAGAWSAPRAIPGLSGSSIYLEGVGCVRAGECLVVGNTSGATTRKVTIVVMTGGAWQAPVTMTAGSPLLSTGFGQSHGLGCVAGGTRCIATGEWDASIAPLSVSPDAIDSSAPQAIAQLTVFPPAPAPPAPEPAPITPKYTG